MVLPTINHFKVEITDIIIRLEMYKSLGNDYAAQALKQYEETYIKKTDRSENWYIFAHIFLSDSLNMIERYKK